MSINPKPLLQWHHCLNADTLAKQLLIRGLCNNIGHKIFPGILFQSGEFYTRMGRLAWSVPICLSPTAKLTLHVRTRETSRCDSGSLSVKFPLETGTEYSPDQQGWGLHCLTATFNPDSYISQRHFIPRNLCFSLGNIWFGVVRLEWNLCFVRTVVVEARVWGGSMGLGQVCMTRNR